MEPTIELREITKDSLAAVLDLAIEPEQEQYVAGVDEVKLSYHPGERSP